MIPVDRAICLSLPHRTDRRESLQRQWRDQVAYGTIPDIEIEFFDAYTPKTSLVPGSWSHKASYYSTNLGHLRILEQLWLDTNWEYAFILEDDALFTSEFTKWSGKFWETLHEYGPDWLAIFFGGHYQRDPKYIAPGLVLNNGSTQSHAYIVNRPGVWRLYDHMWCCQFRICDWAFSDMMGGDACVYSPNPWMITTAEGYSDNLHGWKPQGT